jgi:hypothetical protein
VARPSSVASALAFTHSPGTQSLQMHVLPISPDLISEQSKPLASNIAVRYKVGEITVTSVVTSFTLRALSGASAGNQSVSRTCGGSWTLIICDLTTTGYLGRPKQIPDTTHVDFAQRPMGKALRLTENGHGCLERQIALCMSALIVSVTAPSWVAVTRPGCRVEASILILGTTPGH